MTTVVSIVVMHGRLARIPGSQLWCSWPSCRSLWQFLYTCL